MKAMLLAATALLGAAAVGAAPRFIGATEYGVRPGNELIWRVPVIGATAVEAVKLPQGLTFDAANRTLRGRIAKAGDYAVVLRATDGKDSVTENITVRVGELICLTPPMGWNSWYSFSEGVSQKGMESVAANLIKSGLADYGWTYVNIDDCWQGERVSKGPLQPNDHFPDMKAMCDRIHSTGLKAGIYSSPWVGTYAGFRGSSLDPEVVPLEPKRRPRPTQIFGSWPGFRWRKANHVGPEWKFDIDAKQFADWGFDYIKVDWNPNDVPTTERIYRDLRASGRDIVLSLSNEAPIANAPGLSKIASCWRTTGDIHDRWNEVRAIARKQMAWLKFRSKGHWNDPDILQIGRLGIPNRRNSTFRPSRLTLGEQRYQMTFWCMISAPLLMSSDLQNLDAETKAILADADLIELNQRYAAAPLTLVTDARDFFVLRKDITEDTSVFGLFNDSDKPQTIPLPDGSKETLPAHSAKTVRRPRK